MFFILYLVSESLHRAVVAHPQKYLTATRATELSVFADRLLHNSSCSQLTVVPDRVPWSRGAIWGHNTQFNIEISNVSPEYTPGIYLIMGTRMTTDQIWRTTTSEIMEIFRESLIALVPLMERAHLPWREGKAYDEWDRIASSLFEGIALSSLQWGLGGGGFTEIHVPAYDMVYPDYHQFSFIEYVTGSSLPNSHLLFCKFVTRDSPFDTVQCYEVDDRGCRLGPDPATKSVADARFAFCLRRSSDELVRHEELVIQATGR